MPESTRKEILRLITEDLSAEPWPANVDVDPLTGHKPWRRIRQGNYRIFVRPLTPAELATVAPAADDGYFVARVIDKKDAKSLIKQLGRRAN